MNIELPVIKAKQITLREITIDDYLDYYFIGCSFENTRYLTWGPFKNPSEARLMLERFYVYRPENEFKVCFGIEYNKTKEMIGIVEFHTYYPENNSAEVGFILREDFHHLGIMSKALSYLINFGFEELKLSKIIIGHVDLNYDSEKIIKKFNFKYEFTKYGAFTTKDTNETRNIIYYSLYKEEYERRLV